MIEVSNKNGERCLIVLSKITHIDLTRFAHMGGYVVYFEGGKTIVVSEKDLDQIKQRLS